MANVDDPAALELRDYIQVLRRRKWVIVLATIVAVGSALAISLTQTPTYRGRAELLLQPKSTESLFDPNTGQANNSTRNVQTQIEVLKSRPVRDAVRQKLGIAPP